MTQGIEIALQLIDLFLQFGNATGRIATGNAPSLLLHPVSQFPDAVRFILQASGHQMLSGFVKVTGAVGMGATVTAVRVMIMGPIGVAFVVIVVTLPCAVLVIGMIVVPVMIRGWLFDFFGLPVSSIAPLVIILPAGSRSAVAATTSPFGELLAQFFHSAIGPLVVAFAAQFHDFIANLFHSLAHFLAEMGLACRDSWL